MDRLLDPVRALLGRDRKTAADLLLARGERIRERATRSCVRSLDAELVHEGASAMTVFLGEQVFAAARERDLAQGP